MNRLAFLTMTVLTLTALPAAHGDEPRVIKLALTPAGRPDPAMRYRLFPLARELKDGNAAALYYRAALEFASSDFASSHKGVSAKQRVSEILELPDDKFPRDEAKALLDKYQPTLHEVKIGTLRSRAEWDIPLRDDGVNTLLTEVQHTRSIARLLKLQARLQAIDKDFDGFVDTLRTMIVLARHVSESGTLVSSLVGLAIVGIVVDEIEHLACIPGSPNLYWALTALPEPVIDLKTGLESEQSWLDGSVPYLDIIDRVVLSQEQADELAASLGSLFATSTDGPPPATRDLLRNPASHSLLPTLANYGECKRQLIARGVPPQRVEAMPVVQVVALRWVQTYRELLDEEIAFTRRPHVEARAAFDVLDARRESLVGKPESILADLLLPAVKAAESAFTRQSQRMALLRTIEAVRLYAATQEGKLPAKLADIDSVPTPLDPGLGEPFVYEVHGTTATLRPKSYVIPGDPFEYELSIRN